MYDILRHPRLLPLATGLLAAGLACAPGEAEAVMYAPPGVVHAAIPQTDLLSVQLEDPSGRPLPTYYYRGAVYVAGRVGQAYRIRLTNLTDERVEAVVSVDGRDVISGRLGDYRRQRGYVIAPYGTITVDGFRRSMEQVATFRFSDAAEAYSTRMGTPQHVGVIGVAVFRERRHRPRPVPRPLARPYEDGHRGGSGYGGAPAPYPEARSGSDRRQRAPRKRARAAGSAGSLEATADAAVGPGERTFAPAPAPVNRIGTAYGESRYSVVVETTFRRRNRRRPDRLLTLYYDTPEGLASRGIPVEPPPMAYWPPVPAPWPRDVRFAPPPPRY